MKQRSSEPLHCVAVGDTHERSRYSKSAACNPADMLSDEEQHPLVGMDSAATTTPVGHTELPAAIAGTCCACRRRARTLIFYEVEPKLLAFADELDASGENRQIESAANAVSPSTTAIRVGSIRLILSTRAEAMKTPSALHRLSRKCRSSGFSV